VSIQIELTASEIYLAAQVGARRRINGAVCGKIANKLVDKSKDDWNTEIEAACAECAVAKALDRFWSGAVNSFKSPDLTAARIQVRRTQYVDGHLVHREWDKVGDLYVLVTGSAPIFTVHGYMPGDECRCEEWQKDDFSWWVPQIGLYSIDDLR
jgi:hypothetical protein